MSKINIDLMPWQTEVLNDKTRYQTVFAARMTGKTRFAVFKTIKSALFNKEDESVIYFSPYSQILGCVFEQIKGVCGHLVRHSDYSQMEITLSNWRKIYLRSPEFLYIPNEIQLSHVTFDEMHPAVNRIFNNDIKPLIEKTNGTALFLGRPIHEDSFFMEIYEKGLDIRNPEWKSWKIEVTDNPFISKADLDFARSYMGNALFSQEYEPV